MAEHVAVVVRLGHVDPLAAAHPLPAAHGHCQLGMLPGQFFYLGLKYGAIVTSRCILPDRLVYRSGDVRDSIHGRPLCDYPDVSGTYPAPPATVLIVARRFALSCPCPGCPMRLLLIGAPGAGKGTQAQRLAQRFGIAHISSGDLLRQHVRDGTSLGQTIKSYLDSGDLVPDGAVMDMLRKPVVAAAQARGYVLDGFPRTVAQAEAAFTVVRTLGAEVQAAVHLDVPRDELVRRLLRRGRGSDDTEAVIEHRLQVYRDNTVPLLEYYAGREWMFTVDGTQPAEAVHRDIVTRLQKLAAFALQTW
jgi:adenylate kinase